MTTAAATATIQSHVAKHLRRGGARILRTALSTGILLACALTAGSCAEGPSMSRVESPFQSQIAAPRRRPSRMEGCKEAPVVVVEAPTCG